MLLFGSEFEKDTRVCKFSKNFNSHFHLATGDRNRRKTSKIKLMPILMETAVLKDPKYWWLNNRSWKFYIHDRLFHSLSYVSKKVNNALKLPYVETQHRARERQTIKTWYFLFLKSARDKIKLKNGGHVREKCTSERMLKIIVWIL